jgi:hypothetical protein
LWREKRETEGFRVDAADLLVSVPDLRESCQRTYHNGERATERHNVQASDENDNRGTGRIRVQRRKSTAAS